MDALFSINDDAGDRGFDASVDDVLSLKLRNPVATVASVRFVVWDASGFDASRPPAQNPPRASKDAPLLTLNNGAGSTGASVLAASVTAPVTVAMPDTQGHSWIVRCIVNDGQKTLADGRVVVAPELIHERMIVVRFASGARAVVATESTQYEVDGWAGALADLAAGAGAGTERDDFTHLGGDTSPGSGVRNSAITDLSWLHITNADTGSLQLIDAEPGRPGILRIQTPSSDNRLVALYRGTIDDETAKCFRFSDFARLDFHARMSRTVTCGFRLGLTNEVLVSSAVLETGDYVGSMFVTDTITFADDNVRCVTADGVSFETTILGSMTALGLSSGFHKFTIEQPTLGAVVFKIDGVAVAAHSTAVPGASNAPVAPHAYALNRSGGPFHLDLDLYERVLRQLVR